MVSAEKDNPRRPRWGLFRLNAAVAVGFILVAAITRQWVWTAVPVGQFFGFFLQKGDLCGASAFSEVLLQRDTRKMFGLWVAIVVSMIAFAAASAAGLVTLAPKPLLWINFTLGGLIFGAGTVLAGGCISGCLYKSAMGNLNSIAALLTIPAGIAFVEHGPLTAFSVSIKSVKSVASGGGPITLSSLTGIPFWGWAAIFALVTAAAVGFRKKPLPPEKSAPRRVSPRPSLKRFLEKSWKPWQAGLAIGLLAVFTLLSSASSGRNYPIGVTHGVLHVQELVTDNTLVHVFGPPPAGSALRVLPAGTRKVTWWLVLVVAGLFLGALAGAGLSGRIRLEPKPPAQVLTAMLGGFLVGTGAGFASGCVVGNIISGWALMSVGMFLFGIAVIFSNWIVTYFYLMGGTLAEMPATFRLIFRRR
jgi:uncharacterized membrane protein YedE/YeeE